MMICNTSDTVSLQRKIIGLTQKVHTMRKIMFFLIVIQTILSTQGTPVAEPMSGVAATGALGVQVPRSAYPIPP